MTTPTIRDVGGGTAEADRAAQVRAFDAARAVGDVEAMTAAALAMADSHQFGTVPGLVPAFLHEAYELASGDSRTRLAVAIARAWAYSNDFARAAAFADEALRAAEGSGDASLLADALDAQLLARWGPDDLDARLALTARLEDAVAHLTKVEARMSAYLWRLTTALECLDATAVRRQVRALDLLAADSGSSRVQFFAASRRGMHALLVNDLDAARLAVAEAVRAGNDCGATDTMAIEHELTAAIARQAGDTESLCREAPIFEEFGTREGVSSVRAVGAVVCLAAGEHDRARAITVELAGSGLAGITRDVDWLLTVTSLTEVAASTRLTNVAEEAMRLLEPYAGRGVVNGGGVNFAGIVDDYLFQAARALGRDEQAQAHREAAVAGYEQLGAPWWRQRLGPDRPQPQHGTAHLRPADGIWWVGRDEVSSVRDMKGLHYLRLLLQRPGVQISARDLSDALAGQPASGVRQAGIEMLDRQALAAYRRRLAEIDAELDEGSGWNDAGRDAALEVEREALLAEVRAATGLGGRDRTAGDVDERARVAVRKAIAAAIDRVAVVDAGLARLLTDTVTTGATCCYQPDPDRPVEWVLSG